MRTFSFAPKLNIINMPNNNTNLKAQSKATNTEINVKAWQDSILKKLAFCMPFYTKCIIVKYTNSS